MVKNIKLFVIVYLIFQREKVFEKVKKPIKTNIQLLEQAFCKYCQLPNAQLFATFGSCWA